MKSLLVLLALTASALAAPEEKLPLVVVLHGYGATPEDISPIVENLGVRVRVLAPHGSLPVGQGWGWFPRHATMTEVQFADSIRAASDTLTKTIADDLHAHPTCGRPIVTGFSQGGFLSYALAARSPAVVAFAFPISGYLPKALLPNAKPKDAPMLIAFHGEADDVVPLKGDTTTNARFAELGFQASLRTYANLKHSITVDEAREIRSAIEDAVRAQGCAK